MVISSFITWNFLGSFMGTVIVTMLIVQFLKELPFFKNIHTKYFTFIVALINILAASFANNTFAVAGVYLMLINAIVVTFTATGTYDFVIRPVKIIEKNENDKSIEDVSASVEQTAQVTPARNKAPEDTSL